MNYESKGESIKVTPGLFHSLAVLNYTELGSMMEADLALLHKI